ncbi:MAG: RNA 2',3'-cyclic phosphodiesterase [Candidatus Thorarchaeota archaeon]|nr:RNA 2',3'-cyclic phosphodiesterase [Candidatus Thorarchaeota archaeon]
MEITTPYINRGDNLSNTMRAFLSLDIEDSSLLSNIVRIQGKLDTDAMKVKIVERENIHFTLRFFGDTQISRIQQIRGALSSIELSKFKIRIEGVGAFPTKRNPRVIWIGVTQGEKKINQLKLAVETKLEEIGYGRDKRFHAHATIARVHRIKNRDSILNNLEALAMEQIGDMLVSSFRMTKSTLMPSGPIYETVWEVPLN